ncbi:HAD-like domain-containing protein [Stachybotrys elegans]|uniref:HAD-like domain-containing protein n=1 Tax=Stachybotrys elegans TaxID=80388 RepID=A0A8K0WLM8_9HYPO|nr:HAD-like domain-containing protein [Stachybotrys elegans]
MSTTVIAFDLYGTLLSTSSISEELAKTYGEAKAKSIAAEARRYQLEYSWRVTCMGLYRSFEDLTRASFRQATKEAGVELTYSVEESIMQAYNGLDVFPDVKGALHTLQKTPALDPYVFSNGTVSMINSSLATSPTLSDMTSLFPLAKVVSVEPLKLFKPHKKSYEHLLQTVGKESDPGSVWLVTSNPFDVVGAISAGLKAAWVDRGGLGWIDGLGDVLSCRPSIIVQGVDEAVDAILKV